jgi:2-oxoglutarate ferredoxin oxidoreductase subunit beta
MSDLNKSNTPEAKPALTIQDYKGAASTLCTGCGHDNVTNHIQQAYFKSGIHPFSVAKISGIGCSSKTTAYFMKTAHGFNSIHGRMAPVATGAKIANRNLNILGISGDGDTASIGMGGFIHLIRRNLPMVYIIENNGVYGLTKGQFSATADLGVPLKTGPSNEWVGLDLCSLAIESGASFVARSFSGDGKQLSQIIQAAIEFDGTAIIDVISPCITYANHEGSTKSYDYVKSHKITLQQLGYITAHDPVAAEFNEGDVTTIQLASGAKLLIKKINSESYDISVATHALNAMRTSRDKGEILTGLLYLNKSNPSAIEKMHLTQQALNSLTEAELRPTSTIFNQYLTKFK